MKWLEIVVTLLILLTIVVFINKVEYFLPAKEELNSQILKKAGKNKSDIKKWTDKIGIKSRNIKNLKIIKLVSQIILTMFIHL